MSALLPHVLENIPRPFLVVCEGYGDAQFICSLLEFRNVTNCNVGCPSTKGGTGSGKEAVQKYLGAVRALVLQGKANLTGVLVIVDADDKPKEAFDQMAAAFEDAQFIRPSQAFTIEGTDPRVAVYLIPGPGRTGTLEHILLEAIFDKNQSVERCILTFSECLGGHMDSGTDNQKAKMRMSVLAGAFCKDNPWTPLSLIWKDANNPIPLDSDRFKHVSDFLSAFVA